MSGDLNLAGQWLVKANNDLLNVDNNLNANEIPFDTVCFHCQQAAEKLLKAFLVGSGRPLPDVSRSALDSRRGYSAFW